MDELAVSKFLDHLYIEVDDAENLSQLFLLIEGSFANHDLATVDLLLGMYNPLKSKTIISTGLLRCASRAKLLLPNWQICKDRIYDHLEFIGLDSKHLLRGLL